MEAAIGLQDVDGLKTSAYLLETAKEHIEGNINITDAQKRIQAYYEARSNRQNTEADTKEADIVSSRITALLGEKTFQFSSAEWQTIHRRLFTGVFSHAGTFRTYYGTIIDFASRIEATTKYLELFFENLLMDAKHELRNRYLHVDYQERPVQSETPEFSKCKNCSLKCTLEELAILKVIYANPAVTQKELAGLIGKSERTIKTRTVDLQNKGYLRRANGKRNGRWEVLVDL